MVCACLSMDALGHSWRYLTRVTLGEIVIFKCPAGLMGPTPKVLLFLSKDLL